MKRINLLLLVLFVSSFSFAQVPGYMGKRLSIGYSADLSFSLLYQQPNATEDGLLGINNLHSLNLEYVFKPRAVVCFTGTYAKAGLRETNFDTYGSNGSVSYYPADKTPMKLVSTNFSLGFKIFGRGNLAPVGKYKKLEVIIISSKILYDRYSFYSGGNTTDNKVGPIGTGEFDFHSVALGLTFGRQRIIKDAIILDTGVRFAILVNPVFNALLDGITTANPSSNSTGTPYGMETQFKTDGNQRLFCQQLVSFHIGIGFLAF